MPRAGHDHLYWADANALYGQSLERGKWDPERLYLLLANFPPKRVCDQSLPFLSIDVTESRLADANFLSFSIRRLQSRRPFGRLSRHAGLAQPLFEQNLTQLPYSTFVTKAASRPETALDILSFVIEVSPAISMEFLKFTTDVEKRFDSIVDETLNNRPGALPFDKVIEFRRDLARTFPEPQLSPQSPLPGEDKVRHIWR